MIVPIIYIMLSSIKKRKKEYKNKIKVNTTLWKGFDITL